MFPTSMPTVMGVNTVGDPSTGTGTGVTVTRTFTGSMTPAGTLQKINRGRIFGRPGTVTVTLETPGTLALRIRRD